MTPSFGRTNDGAGIESQPLSDGDAEADRIGAPYLGASEFSEQCRRAQLIIVTAAKAMPSHCTIASLQSHNHEKFNYRWRLVGCGAVMIKNGLYSLNAVRHDGADGAVGGVLILNEGQLCGGDAFVYYVGSYESSAGNWQGKMTSHEHTPTGRPIAARTQHIGFYGKYSDAGAAVDAMALVGQQNIRYDAILRLLAAT
jgi:hypothetical protein